MNPVPQAVAFDTEAERVSAEAWAERLGLSVVDPGAFEGVLLTCAFEGLKLVDTRHPEWKPLFVDFTGGRMVHRVQQAGRKQLLGRAVGIKPGYLPRVLDATAGLGQDAFVLAVLGCEVLMIERHPLVAAVLEDAVGRAREDEKAGEAADRMHVHRGDARVLIPHLAADEAPDVVYLDPMFPERRKSAAVKKPMQLLQALLGHGDDAVSLLDAGLAAAGRRVVVKRPKGAEDLGGREPDIRYKGKTVRYDVYLCA